jgi:hypothetical protein
MTEGVERQFARRLAQDVDRYSRVVVMLSEYGEAWRLLGGRGVALYGGPPGPEEPAIWAIRRITLIP